MKPVCDVTARVIHGDCQTLLATLENDSVDHAITDPPYSKHTHEAQRRGATGYAEGTSRRAQIARTRDLGFEALEPGLRWLVAFQLARVVKRWSVIFTDHEGGYGWAKDLESAGLEVVRFGIWRKLGATPQFTGDRPAQGHEVIVIAHRPGKKRWNSGGKHAVWEVPIVLDRAHKGARLHTTQKPLVLMEALIRDFTDPGEVILDPFAGSGTTLVAAKRLGRGCIGMERDEKYAKAATRRLEDTSEQQEMFDKRAKARRRQLQLVPESGDAPATTP